METRSLLFSLLLLLSLCRILKISCEIHTVACSQQVEKECRFHCHCSCLSDGVLELEQDTGEVEWKTALAPHRGCILEKSAGTGIAAASETWATDQWVPRAFGWLDEVFGVG